jgi:hypothetical protein
MLRWRPRVRLPSTPLAPLHAGVSWVAAKNKWIVYIYDSGRPRYLAYFDTEEAAARAYDKEAKRVHTDPVLNFLPDGSLNPNRKQRVSQL